MDPRIRIHTKTSCICNTGPNLSELKEQLKTNITIEKISNVLYYKIATHEHVMRVVFGLFLCSKEWIGFTEVTIAS
jgi:hypothetical protein